MIAASPALSPAARQTAHRAAYQGVPGAFSEQAAQVLVGADTPLLPCPTLDDVLRAVQTGRASEAIIPIENSLAGTVPRAYELLVDHELTAIAETRLRIDHMLIARPGTRLDDVRQVHSHPVALNQCRRFIAAHGLTPVAAFDTAGAVEALMREGGGSDAAIASRRAAERHGGVILAERIQDQLENWTRFLRLVPAQHAPAMRGRNGIVTFRLRHEPGSLSRALSLLAAAGLNLTKIESRPIPDRPFEYAFLIEVTAQHADPDWPELLAPLETFAVGSRLIAAYGA